MNKFRDALYRFMYGRNGVDALNWALVILELAVSILSSIIRVQGVSQALYFVSMVLMFIVLIRIFSRNLARRQAETRSFWPGGRRRRTPFAARRHAAPTRRTNTSAAPAARTAACRKTSARSSSRAEVRQEKSRENVKENPSRGTDFL